MCTRTCRSGYHGSCNSRTSGWPWWTGPPTCPNCACMRLFLKGWFASLCSSRAAATVGRVAGHGGPRLRVAGPRRLRPHRAQRPGGAAVQRWRLRGALCWLVSVKPGQPQAVCCLCGLVASRTWRSCCAATAAARFCFSVRSSSCEAPLVLGGCSWRAEWAYRQAALAISTARATRKSLCRPLTG